MSSVNIIINSDYISPSKKNNLHTLIILALILIVQQLRHEFYNVIIHVTGK